MEMTGRILATLASAVRRVWVTETVAPACFRKHSIFTSCAYSVVTAGFLLAYSLSAAGVASVFEPAYQEQEVSGASVTGLSTSAVGRSRIARLQFESDTLWQAAPSRSSLRAAAARPDFDLNLFADRSLPVTITKIERRGGGGERSVVFGTVLGSPESSVILAFDGGTMAGSVFIPGQRPVRIQYAGDGVYEIAELDPEAIPPCAADGARVMRAAAVGNPPTMSGDALTRVDVLVLYTRAARVAAGSAVAMDATILAAVAEANQAFGNSAVPLELNLVHTEETPYSETGNPETDLGRLQGRNDGFLENIHTLRTAYGADVIVMLTEQMENFAGLAYVTPPSATNAASFAFAVVKREFALGSQTFAHEVAHVFGCQHDRAHADAGGAFDYSYGHHFEADGNAYRTVMAYPPGQRIPYFSNPEISYLGVPTGVAAGSPDSANNALTLQTTAPLVAGFATEATMLGFETSVTNITEGSFTMQVKVTRGGDTSGISTVRYATAGITAGGGSDYLAATGGVRFEAGETNKTIALTIINDSAVEAQETMKLVLSTPTNAVLGFGREMLVRIDDDDTGITLESATASVAENGTNLVIEIRRMGDISRTNTVAVTTAGVSATAGLDFVGTNATVVFTPGMTNATFSVPLLDDQELETNETLRVFLSNASGGAGLVKPTNLVAAILENDSGLAFATNAVNVLENAGSATLKVIRTGGLNYRSTCQYFTSDGTATNVIDYAAASGTLTFDPGVKTLTIPIAISNNQGDKGDRVFRVTLTNAELAQLAAPFETMVTIKDTDATYAFAAPAATIGEGDASLTLSVIRSGGVAGVGTVKFATSPGTADTGKDFVPKSGVLSFKPGETVRTITLPVLNDPDIEPTEAFSVTLSDPDEESALGTNAVCDISLLDDDSLISFDTNQVIVSESADEAVLTLHRTGSLGMTNALSFRVVPVTAINADFSGGVGRAVFLPGQTNAEIVVPIVNDALVEGPERFAVVISGATGGAVIRGTNTAYVHIADDEVGLAFEVKVVSIAENGTNVVVNVTQTGDTNQPVSVQYRTRDEGAAAGLDYLATNGVLNFGPGTNVLAITVPVLDDALLETNETFRISLTNAVGATLLGSSNLLVKILENDTGFTFRTNNLTASEQQPFVTVTIMRTGGTNYPGSVDFATSNLTAVAGLDYVATNGTIEFVPGAATRSFAVPLLNDAVADGDKTIRISLTNAMGAALGEFSTCTISIRDNDSIFEFSTNALTVWEGGGISALTVLRLGGTAGVATVRLGSTNGTAIAPGDYSPQNGQLSFADGEASKTIKLSIVNDTSIEPEENFTVFLSTPGGEASLGTNISAGVTITDNDCLLSVAAQQMIVNEGDGIVTLAFNRTGTLTGTNTLAFRLGAGSATGPDYRMTNQLITFLPGTTSASLTLGIVDDTIVENPETFTVQISNPNDGGKIQGTNTIYITIVDNETGLGFSAPRFAVGENGTNVAVTIVQLGNTNLSATVDFATLDGGAKAGFDYTPTNGTLQFGPGTNRITIEIPILDDAELETNETFLVALANPVGASVLTNLGPVVILEDDTSISFTTNSVRTLENVPQFYLSVVRHGGTNQAVSADFLFIDDSAVGELDYATPTNLVVLFPPGITRRSLAITVLNDRLVEGDETFQVLLTNLVGAGLGAYASATATILDNDNLVEFETTELDVGEAAGVTLVNVRRTGGLASGASVRYATTNLTALTGSDYLAKSGTLSFRPGETNKTITLQIINDSVIDPGENFKIQLVAALGETALGTNVSATLTIVDNDVAAGDLIVDQIEPMRIRSIERSADGCATLLITAPRGAALLIENSSDLIEWTELGIGMITEGPVAWEDCAPDGERHQFYRVRQPSTEPEE